MASESESMENHVNKEKEANSNKPQQSSTNNFLSIPGVTGMTELNRTSSLPGGIDAIDGPVQLRFQSKGSRKRAQIIRNSIAVTNSDYYNEFRPQVFRRHSQRSTIPNTPSLDPISEYEMKAYGRRLRPSSTAISPLVISNENADPNMFQYTSTPILDPARQTVPTPLSRAGTPSIVTEAVKADVSASIQRNSSFRTITPTDITPAWNRRPTSVVFEDESPTEPKIPFSSDNENKFLPLYMNQESSRIYMFEDGYYIPVPPQQLSDLLEGTKNVVKQPPAPDRRAKMQPSPTHSQRPPTQQRPRSILIEPPSDYLRFVQVLMVLFLVFLDLPVFLMCSLPALVCALKVRKSNQNGHLIKAKKHSEYVLCFIVLGITFHILIVLSLIMVFLLLHFVGDVF